MRTNYISLILAFAFVAAATASEAILNTTGNFNYFDWAGFGTSEARYTEPTAGVFESVPGGVLFRANRYRGGGSIITKATYYLPGGSAEFVWSGGGGNSFMQPVCGAFTKSWPTESGNADASMVIATYGNSWNGSWVATPGRVYKTTVTFTSNSYALSTKDYLTDQYMGGTSGGFDFTKPVHLYLRTGDTFDYQNAYLELKSLKINGHLATPLAPQKVFLAFGQPSSFSVSYHSEYNKRIPIPNPFGSLPAASVSDSYRNEATQKIKDIFTRSGVSNIEWVDTAASDSINVYFCPTLNPDLLYGYSLYPPNRFNSRRGGKAIVFFDGDSSQGAKTAAHEIGHLLGLRHVMPNNQEVMTDDGDTTAPLFVNAVSDITDPIYLHSILSPRTHNPLYHLLRYVDGWSQTQLQNGGIIPGAWDTGGNIITQFDFGGSNLRLHNIKIFVSGGESESTHMLEQITTATLAELSQHSFNVPPGKGLIVLASSTAEGALDVISSTGDPFNPLEQVVTTDDATTPFTLFRQTSATNAVAISTAVAKSDSQSLYCDISLMPPNILRLEFRGTLQQSPNLSDWSDIGLDTTSPHFVVIPSGQGAGFFRSKQPATP